jgi:hypothetical protein
MPLLCKYLVANDLQTIKYFRGREFMFIFKSFNITSTLITTISINITDAVLNNFQLNTQFSCDIILSLLVYTSYIKIRSML